MNEKPNERDLRTIEQTGKCLTMFLNADGQATLYMAVAMWDKQGTLSFSDNGSLAAAINVSFSFIKSELDDYERRSDRCACSSCLKAAKLAKLILATMESIDASRH